MARDEARHGKALKGLLDRYFGKYNTVRSGTFCEGGAIAPPSFLRFHRPLGVPPPFPIPGLEKAPHGEGAPKSTVLRAVTGPVLLSSDRKGGASSQLPAWRQREFPRPSAGRRPLCIAPTRFRGLAAVSLAPVPAISRPSRCRPGIFSRSNSDGAPNAVSRKRPCGLYSCRRPWEGTAFRRSVPLPFSAAAPCSAGWGSGAQGKPAVYSLSGFLIPLPAPMPALLSGFHAGCRKRRLSRRKAFPQNPRPPPGRRRRLRPDGPGLRRTDPYAGLLPLRQRDAVPPEGRPGVRLMPGAVPAIPLVRRLKNSSRSAAGSSSRAGRSRIGMLRSIVPSLVSLSPI